MKYKTAIHTLEIEPLLADGKNLREWAKEVYNSNFPFVNRLEKDKKGINYRLYLNPHRLNTIDDGRYMFRYGVLEEHTQIMQNICALLGIEGYIVRRLDICLDTEQPYEATAKIMRIIMLMLSNIVRAVDRYQSIDPLTMEMKTFRIQNGSYRTNKYKSIEIEHYNRSQIDQTLWANEPIINRFEMRSMGIDAGITNNEKKIICKWIKRLKLLTHETLEQLEILMSDVVFNGWEEYSRLAENTSSTAFNGYLKENRAHIYTHAQLLNIMERFKKGKANRRKGNLIQESGNLFRLYKWREIKAEITVMIDALTGYIDGE